jgi:hypothetical protein
MIIMVEAARFTSLNPQIFIVRFRTADSEQAITGISRNNTAITRTDSGAMLAPFLR